MAFSCECAADRRLGSLFKHSMIQIELGRHDVVHVLYFNLLSTGAKCITQGSQSSSDLSEAAVPTSGPASIGWRRTQSSKR
jgi:hypothetical protein